MLEQFGEESSENGGKADGTQHVTHVVQLGGMAEELEHESMGEEGDSDHADQHGAVLGG